MLSSLLVKKSLEIIWKSRFFSISLHRKSVFLLITRQQLKQLDYGSATGESPLPSMLYFIIQS